MLHELAYHCRSIFSRESGSISEGEAEDRSVLSAASSITSGEEPEKNVGTCNCSFYLTAILRPCVQRVLTLFYPCYFRSVISKDSSTFVTGTFWRDVTQAIKACDRSTSIKSHEVVWKEVRSYMISFNPTYNDW